MSTSAAGPPWPIGHTGRAFAADPADGRTLYEWDQLEKRRGRPAPGRLARLKAHCDLVEQRDDLAVELATLYNDLGRPGTRSRGWPPVASTPGKAAKAWSRASTSALHLRLAQAVLREGRRAMRGEHIAAAMHYPENLGEGKHLLTPQSELHFHLGLALEALGDEPGARLAFERAADPLDEPGSGDRAGAAALRGEPLARVSRSSDSAIGSAPGLLRDLRAARAARLARRTFASTTSPRRCPTFLLFKDDLERQQPGRMPVSRGTRRAGSRRVAPPRGARSRRWSGSTVARRRALATAGACGDEGGQDIQAARPTLTLVGV